MTHTKIVPVPEPLFVQMEKLLDDVWRLIDALEGPLPLADHPAVKALRDARTPKRPTLRVLEGGRDA